MIDSDKLTALGRLLRSARLKKELNIWQAAKQMGMTPLTLSRYELGASPVPTVENIHKMSVFYALTLDLIFSKIEEDKNEKARENRSCS